MAVNREIREHPLGIPVPGDVLVFQSLQDLKTYRVPVDQLLPSGTSNNIEWTSAKAAAGDYDENVIVTRGGDIWQSTVDNNESVPGTNADWELLTKGKSGFVMWAAGVFLEDEVFVLNQVGGVVYVFHLASETRPYNSTNFTTELNAGDWEVVGNIEVVEVETAGETVTLDMLNLPALAFKGDANISGNKDVAISNDGAATEIRFFKFQASANVQLTFESDVRHNVWDGAWNTESGLIWTAPADGVYIMKASRADSLWFVEISGPYPTT